MGEYGDIVPGRLSDPGGPTQRYLGSAMLLPPFPLLILRLVTCVIFPPQQHHKGAGWFDAVFIGRGFLLRATTLILVTREVVARAGLPYKTVCFQGLTGFDQELLLPCICWDAHYDPKVVCPRVCFGLALQSSVHLPFRMGESSKTCAQLSDGHCAWFVSTTSPSDIPSRCLWTAVEMLTEPKTLQEYS